MKTTLKLHFYDKSQKELKEMNELLNPYGIIFTQDQEEHTNKDGKKTTQKLLHIDVNEDLLHQYKKNGTGSAGRPTIQIDYNKLVKLKRQDKTINEICKELGISRALYYQRIVSSIDSLNVGTKVEYHPLDADDWYLATVQIDGKGTKFLQGNDGIADYPRRSDVIRKLDA